MKGNNKTIRRVAYSMTWRGNNLCFLFYGTTKQAVRDVFESINMFYGECHVTEEKVHITNGKCHQSIIAIISDPHTNILPDKEWNIMITRFLQKTLRYEIIYYEDYNKFLNL